MARVKRLSPEEIHGLKDFINEYLEFNGRNFYWKKASANCIKIGQQAGTLKSKGYRQIMIKGKSYYEHRLVWLLAEGYYPQDEEDIDHVNGIRDDNRPENLRLVSPSCNIQNQYKRCTNTSGVVGVHWHKTIKKWMAKITIKGKTIYLGLYNSKLEAAYARLAAELLHPDWKCNAQNQIVKDIKKLNPGFNLVSFNPENRIKNKNWIKHIGKEV